MNRLFLRGWVSGGSQRGSASDVTGDDECPTFVVEFAEVKELPCQSRLFFSKGRLHQPRVEFLYFAEELNCREWLGIERHAQYLFTVSSCPGDRFEANRAGAPVRS